MSALISGSEFIDRVERRDKWAGMPVPRPEPVLLRPVLHPATSKDDNMTGVFRFYHNGTSMKLI